GKHARQANRGRSGASSGAIAASRGANTVIVRTHDRSSDIHRSKIPSRERPAGLHGSVRRKVNSTRQRPQLKQRKETCAVLRRHTLSTPIYCFPLINRTLPVRINVKRPINFCSSPSH